MNELAAMLASEVWAIKRAGFDALAKLADMDTSAAVGHVASTESEPYTIDGDTATVKIHGPMMRSVPGWFDFFGIAATDTVKTTAAVMAAASDDRIDRIVLSIDSPGGQVSGIAELADAIKAASASRPVDARVGSMMASAAMWVGAQASSITATRGSEIGSIGTYAVVSDWSKAMEADGIKVHVVSSHELKGAFVFGSEVTDSQIKDLRREIDDITAMFVEDVAAGRKLKPKAAAALATGQVWLAAEALERGLIDTITTPATTGGRVTNQAPSAQGETAMTIEEVQAQLAKTQADLDAANARADEAEANAAAECDAAAEANLLLKDAQAKAKAATAAQVDAIIKANPRRVTPDKLEAVRGYAAFCGEDVAAFGAYVATLPEAVNTEQRSASPGFDNTDKADDSPSATDIETAKTFGISAAAVAKATAAIKAGATGIDHDGNLFDATNNKIEGVN
jgi:signal peptide peptidase SppA